MIKPLFLQNPLTRIFILQVFVNYM